MLIVSLLILVNRRDRTVTFPSFSSFLTTQTTLYLLRSQTHHLIIQGKKLHLAAKVTIMSQNQVDLKPMHIIPNLPIHTQKKWELKMALPHQQKQTFSLTTSQRSNFSKFFIRKKEKRTFWGCPVGGNGGSYNRVSLVEKRRVVSK